MVWFTLLGFSEILSMQIAAVSCLRKFTVYYDNPVITIAACIYFAVLQYITIL